MNEKTVENCTMIAKLSVLAHNNSSVLKITLWSGFILLIQRINLRAELQNKVRFKRHTSN